MKVCGVAWCGVCRNMNASPSHDAPARVARDRYEYTIGSYYCFGFWRRGNSGLRQTLGVCVAR